MFQKICIKSNELAHEQMNVPFLIDSMLFYGKVIVLAHRAELVTLLKVFDEDFLEELIRSGRIELLIRENVLGAMNLSEGRHTVDLFSKVGEGYTSTLYESHRLIYRNSIKNIQFADRFSKICLPFKYPQDIVSEIKASFEDSTLLRKLLPIYLNTHVPTFQVPEKVEIEIIKDKGIGDIDAYSLRTNLDHNKINEASKAIYGDKHHDFDYSSFLLSLSESKGDIYLSSKFESELVTRRLYSQFIDLQLKEVIKKRKSSQDNLDLFHEYILKDCHTLGEAFVNKVISKKELLELLEKADKFRGWLSKVPEDRNLIGEYHQAVTKETFADKLPTKTTRFVIFEGIGLTLDLSGAGGIGTAIATGLSALDTFVLDKLIQGWKPNHYIDGDLKPKTHK